MKHFDLFTGFGGFSLACKNNNIQTIGFSEIDSYAIAVYKYHFPEVKNYGDITTINPEILPDFDILTFGSPCQDLSVAGKKEGLTGRRSGLFFQAVTILKRKKPSYFIFENVRGVYSSNGGKDFGIIFNQLSEAGYDYQWQILNAKDFGIPQNRERIFIVGHLRGKSRPEIFPIRKDDLQYPKFGKGNEGKKDITWSLKARDYKDDTNFIIHNLQSRNPERPSKLKGQSGGSGYFSKEDDIIYTIDTKNTQGIEVISRGKFGENKPREYGDQFPTLMTGDLPMITTWTPLTEERNEEVKETEPQDKNRRIRRLTPLECERLMGLPDRWTEKGIENGKVIDISDTQRYKLCGNGVVIQVVDEIIRRIVENNKISIEDDEKRQRKLFNQLKYHSKKGLF